MTTVRKFGFILGFTLAATLLWSLAATAADTAPMSPTERLVRAMLTKQATYQTIQAEFTQERQVKVLNQTLLGSGSVWFARPLKMRWSYREPMESHLVSNGDTLWFYVPELQQAQVMDLRGNPAVQRIFETIALGSGAVYEQVARHFEIFALKSGNVLNVTLKPRADSRLAGAVRQISLKVNATTMLPLAVVITDANHDRTRFAFTKVVPNREIDPALFTFTPPAGVQLVAIEQPQGLW